mgnify:FL=1
MSNVEIVAPPRAVAATEGGDPWKASTRRLLLALTTAYLVFGGLVGFAWYRLGSYRAVVELASGRPLIVDEATTKLGTIDGAKGDVTAHVRITNASFRSVSLVGHEQAATCVLRFDHLPVTIAPLSAVEVPVWVQSRAWSGSIDQEITLFTSHPSRPRLAFRMTGTVEKRPSPRDAVSQVRP